MAQLVNTMPLGENQLRQGDYFIMSWKYLYRDFGMKFLHENPKAPGCEFTSNLEEDPNIKLSA